MNCLYKCFKSIKFTPLWYTVYYYYEVERESNVIFVVYSPKVIHSWWCWASLRFSLMRHCAIFKPFLRLWCAVLCCDFHLRYISTTCYIYERKCWKELKWQKHTQIEPDTVCHLKFIYLFTQKIIITIASTLTQVFSIRLLHYGYVNGYIYIQIL